MVPWKQRAVSALPILLACWVVAGSAQQSPLQPEQTSCESKLHVWKENGMSFVNQVIELEAQNRDLKMLIATLTKERNDALDQLKLVVPPSAKEK
jgi:hypothetical protein